MWAPKRSAGARRRAGASPGPGRPEVRRENRRALAPGPLELPSDEHQMGQAPQGAEREPVHKPVLDPRAAALLEEEMAMFPARVRTAELHVEEPKRGIPLADEHAEPEREAEPADPVVEDRAGPHADRARREELRGAPDGGQPHQVRGVGEEREDLGSPAREPLARLEAVISRASSPPPGCGRGPAARPSRSARRTGPCPAGRR